MNRKGLILGLAVAAMFAATAVAQESYYWLDTRPNNSVAGSVNNVTGALLFGTSNPYINTGINTGRRGAGTILRVEPVHADGYHTANPGAFPNHDGDNNTSTGDLWLYADVDPDTDPDSTSLTTDEVISSLGLDIDLIKGGTTTQVRGTIGSLNFQLMNDGSVFNSKTPTAQAPWNNFINGAATPVVGGTPSWAGIKAVRVPVSAGPMYDASLGITPRVHGLNDTPYRLGVLHVQSGTRNCTLFPAGSHVANSTFNVFLKVNNLLITRVFNGAGDSPAAEDARFGFSGAVFDPQAVDGNTIGATTALADAQIEIRVKGDFTGDGSCTGADTTPYNTAAGAGSDDPFEAFAGDFSGDNQVTGADTTPYNDALTQNGTGGGECP